MCAGGGGEGRKLGNHGGGLHRGFLWHSGYTRHFHGRNKRSQGPVALKKKKARKRR